MFELRLRGIDVRFDFSFFATVALLTLLSGDGYAIMGLTVCLWHEMGHFTAMRLCGVRVNRLVLYGAGIRIVPDKAVDFTPTGTALFIYLAGSCANFLAAAVLYLWDNPSVRLWAAVNGVIGAFNLLPLQYLDGGKILLLVIRRLCDYERACQLEHWLRGLNVTLIIIVLIAFTTAGRGNFTLYLTLCYLLISAISCQ